MTLNALLKFLRGGIKMSHIYQPVLIRTLLNNGGACTRRQLAVELLLQDESQIEYYEKRLRDMPLPVLRKRGVISEASGFVRLQVGKLSLEEKASILLECDSLIQKFIAKRGMKIWDHRMIDDDPVPDSMRFKVLMRDKQRCLLCGATAKDTRLHVDHIIPRSKRGSNDINNLQTLCFQCNGGKNNKDSTDFREVGGSIHEDSVSDKIRYEVLMHNVLVHNGRCNLCKATSETGSLHVERLSEGGAETLDNFQTLCSKCRRGKNNKKRH